VAAEPNILVFANSHEEGDPMATRLSGMGFRPLLAKTADAAQEIVCDPRYAIQAVFFSTESPFMELSAALSDLQARSGNDELTFVVRGPRPDKQGIARLREAGIDLVAWEPCPDAVLRFQLNRALGDRSHANERAADRVPVARKARIISGRLARPAEIYTLSASGAFIETPRPGVRGSRVLLELVLPRRDVVVEGRVVHTNVPGNLHKGAMPLGMGVRFVDLPLDAEHEIVSCIHEAAKAISLEPAPQRRGGGIRRILRALSED
jgi:hypothetical protein